MVGVTTALETVLKGRSIKKVEDHCATQFKYYVVNTYQWNTINIFKKYSSIIIQYKFCVTMLIKWRWEQKRETEWTDGKPDFLIHCFKTTCSAILSTLVLIWKKWAQNAGLVSYMCGNVGSSYFMGFLSVTSKSNRRDVLPELDRQCPLIWTFNSNISQSMS